MKSLLPNIRAMSTRTPYRPTKPLIGAPLPTTPSSPSPSPLTHYRITLHRSAIGLPERMSATLEALGIHKRMQTVYHVHSPDIAGKILRVKELVEVQNVPAEAVRTPAEARAERKAVRGYEVVQRRASAPSFGLAVQEEALRRKTNTASRPVRAQAEL